MGMMYRCVLYVMYFIDIISERCLILEKNAWVADPATPHQGMTTFFLYRENIKFFSLVFFMFNLCTYNLITGL